MSGKYLVACDAKYYETLEKQVTVPANNKVFELKDIVLKNKKTCFKLNSKPTGATVILNGSKVSGTTPFTINTEQGKYSLLIEKNDFFYEGTVLLDKDKVNLTQSLSLRTGTISVIPQPSSAIVKLNSCIVSKDKQSNLAKVPGTYTLTVACVGYKSFTKEITVIAGENKVERVDLKQVYSASISGKPFKSKTGIEFAWIPSGSFVMGCSIDELEIDSLDADHRRVTISKGFWMGKYEVTQGQWQVVMGNNPSKYYINSDSPVTHVNFNHCQTFISKLNSGVSGGKFHLPTEAQWEYSCRAGTKTPFHFGSNITTSQANYNGNYPYYGASEGTYRRKFIAVGTFLPNGFGLYDMHGNVYEWCSDWYKIGYRIGYHKGFPDVDPQGPNSGHGRIVRGGSWNSSATDCCSACRNTDPPDKCGKDLGLRLAFSLSP